MPLMEFDADGNFVRGFGDKAAWDAALAAPVFEELVADFDRNFPESVTGTRDRVTLAAEQARAGAAGRSARLEG